MSITKILLYPLLITIGFGIGSLAPSRFTDDANAHLLFTGHVDYYSFSGSPCYPSQYVDPVSIVFTGYPYTAEIDQHAKHHPASKPWTNKSGTSQRFYSHGCVPMDGQNADGCGVCDRKHMRYYWDYDPYWTVFAVATPHEEDFVEGNPGCNYGVGKHAVDDNWDEPPGGFVKGKYSIRDNWDWWGSPGAPHLFMDAQYWGNTALFQQCDGGDSSNDGWIDFVEVFDR